MPKTSYKTSLAQREYQRKSDVRRYFKNPEALQWAAFRVERIALDQFDETKHWASRGIRSGLHPELIRWKIARKAPRAPGWSARHYAERRDQMIAAGKRWRTSNPEANRILKRRARQKRKALKMGVAISETLKITAWENRWKSKRVVKCFWCGGKQSPNRCHTDHIIAHANGGAHAIENLCISCGPCNLTKRAKPLDVWNSEIAQPVLL